MSRKSFNPCTMGRTASLLVLVVLAAGLTGCSWFGGKKTAGAANVPIKAPTPVAQPAPRTEGIPEPRRETPVEEPNLKRVYFDFDKSNIRKDQAETLNNNAKWLLDNAKAVIQIEGHCDERGTREYNYALGERRAKSIIDAMVKKGVAPDRLHPISYGKDRPEKLGHNEDAWKWNRRAVFMRFPETK